MSHSTYLKFSFSILAFIALVCACMPTFAQRGGHGGGFRGGGGGFHGGGGFRGGAHSYARPSMGRGIHGRPGGFGSSRFNRSRFTGSRFSGGFGRSRFGVRNSIISQPRFGFGDGDFDFDDGFFGDGDFDFDDGFGFRGLGFGCFGCGFGWGWGFGSWSWWSPWWPNTWWGWPVSNVYPYSNPNPNTANVAESAPVVLLYLKDGTTLAATDYWVADGKLHYRVSNGGERTLDMNDLDLQRTVDENAKRGMPFTLKPFQSNRDYGPGTSKGYAQWREESEYEEPNEESRPMIIVYLQDGGGSYDALDYWLTNDTLHIETIDGTEKSFLLDQVDVQRTFAENTARGVTFTFFRLPSPSDPGPMLAPDSYAPDCPSPSQASRLAVNATSGDYKRRIVVRR